MEAIKYAYENKGFGGDVHHPIVKATGEQLSGAVDAGYGILKDVDFDSPDYIMREYLKRNIWKFSVAKNYNDCVRLSNLLIRPDGSMRPWNEFKREAERVVGDSNRYLKTEYDTIVSGAQMSRLWQEIQRDKHIFPYVQLDVVLDKRTSDICEPLAGLIFEVDDPVLAYYFPPNHFNCRTNARKLRHGVPSKNYQLPDIPEEFKNNAGISGQIFTDKNRYIENTPEDILNDSLYLRDLRARIMKRAEETYIGKNFKLSTGEEISVSRKGIKHFLNQSHDNIIEKNLLGYNLENIFKDATYIKSADDSKGRKQFKYHYYKVNGKSNMFIVIREVLATGEKQFYSVVQSIK